MKTCLMCSYRAKLGPILGRIQDLTKGGSDKRPPKAVAPRGVRGMFPRKIFNVRASEMAQICLVFIAVFAYKDTKKYPFQKIYLLAELVPFFFNHVFVIHFYVQFRGFDRTTRTTPRSAPAISRRSRKVFAPGKP